MDDESYKAGYKMGYEDGYNKARNEDAFYAGMKSMARFVAGKYGNIIGMSANSLAEEYEEENE